MLLIEREGLEHAYAPLVSCVSGAPRDDAEERLWRGAFPVALDLESGPRGSFALRLRDDLVLALPAPNPTLFGHSERGRRARRWPAWPYAVRRTTLLLVVT
jgi:hypothetical protein